MSRSAFHSAEAPSVSLLDVACPPEGYRFERMLCMTYSLDARMAVALMAAGFNGSADLEADGEILLKGNPFEVRAFVRRVLERSLFFVQHSAQPIQGTVSQEIWPMLQDRVFTVAVPGQGIGASRRWVNFHPKVVLVEFSKGSERRLRIYLGSRNLSLASARESGLILDFVSRQKAAKGTAPASTILAPLKGFLEQVLIEAKRRQRKGSRRDIDDLQEWIASLSVLSGRLCCTLPKNITAVELFGQWPGGRSLHKRVAKDLRRARRALVVSPWIDQAGAVTLDRMLPRRSHLQLWVLESEVKNLRHLLGRAPQIVDELARTIYERGAEKELPEIGFSWRHHAKVYALDLPGRHSALWLGSANWTRPGLGLEPSSPANFEILVRATTRGVATKLFGGLRTKRLDDALIRNAPEAPDSKENHLDLISGDWLEVGRVLRIQTASRTAAAPCRFLELSALTDESEKIALGKVPWKKLLEQGSYDLETSVPKGSALQAILLMRCDPAGRHPGGHLHVPLPDDLAGLRLSRALPEIDVESAESRLAQLQDGISGSRLRKSKGRGGRAGGDPKGLLRLEKLFLRITNDPDAFADAEEIFRCLEEAGREGSGLLIHLRPIMDAARKINGSRDRR